MGRPIEGIIRNWPWRFWSEDPETDCKLDRRVIPSKDGSCRGKSPVAAGPWSDICLFFRMGASGSREVSEGLFWLSNASPDIVVIAYKGWNLHRRIRHAWNKNQSPNNPRFLSRSTTILRCAFKSILQMKTWSINFKKLANNLIYYFNYGDGWPLYSGIGPTIA